MNEANNPTEHIPTAAEFSALKQNRDAVLAEKRDLKAKLEALQAQLAEATAGFDAERTALIERAEKAEKHVADYEVNFPVENFLLGIAVDVQTFKHVFGEQYRFSKVDGDIGVVDLEGKPVKLDDGKGNKRLVRLDRKDFDQLLYPAEKRTDYQERFGKLLIASKASGGGANSAGSGSGVAGQPAAKPQPAVPTVRYGLGRKHR